MKKFIKPTPKVHPVEQAVRDFEANSAALSQFIAANEKTFDTFNALVENYNKTNDLARETIKTTNFLTGVYTGPFKYSKAPESIVYDVDKLPLKVKKLKGVVTADNKVIKSLIEAGQITEDEVRNAANTVLGTPRISGPKAIEFKL